MSASKNMDEWFQRYGPSLYGKERAEVIDARLAETDQPLSEEVIELYDEVGKVPNSRLAAIGLAALIDEATGSKSVVSYKEQLSGGGREAF